MPQDHVFERGFRQAQSLPSPMPRDGTSLVLSNLRGLVIVVVVAFHSALAYLGSLTPSALQFDSPPFQWRAFPIIDQQRWFGFDIFCAWQDVYLMALMFWLSALFTWPSLTRKGEARFLADRFVRLGLPFLFAVTVLMPIAVYPSYRVTLSAPGLAAYARHYLALPFWPNGPAWFLWQLLALTVLATAVHRYAPDAVNWLGRLSRSAEANPASYFAGLTLAAILAYVPLALFFTPFAWADHGPFGLQFCRPLLYGVGYFAGLGVGAVGLERGLFAPHGMLARRWPVWLAGALGAFIAWMGLTALTMNDPAGNDPAGGSIGLRVLVDASFAIACASGCFGVMASCLRFATRRSRLLDILANNAFAIYLLHYPLVVWLQYTLLGLALPAIVKFAVVLAVSLSLSWAAAAALRRIPFGARLIGESPPAAARVPVVTRVMPVPR